MQRMILDAMKQCQKERTKHIRLEQHTTILNNIGEQFEGVGNLSIENLLAPAISARILASSRRAKACDDLLSHSFTMAETSKDLEDEKLAILKGESRKWSICRINLSTAGIDLVVIRNDRQIFQDPDWRKQHLRYMHFGSETQEHLLLLICGRYLLYQRQEITGFSNGQEAKLIDSSCLYFDDYRKLWRLHACYNCREDYSAEQIWTKTVYDKPFKER